MLLDNYPENNIYQTIEEISKQRKGAWMLTFNDLLSLLLTFFILLYSLSEYSTGKWHDISQSLGEKFRAEPEFEVPFTKTIDIDYLYMIIMNKIKENPELNNIFLQNLTDKLIISLPMSSLFKENSDEIMLGGESIIYLLSSTLFVLDNAVSVNAIGDVSSIDPFYGSPKIVLNLNRATKIANMLQENSFLSNVKIFILNKEYYKIESSKETKSYTTNEDRIDIVINDEEVENNYNYNVK